MWLHQMSLRCPGSTLVGLGRLQDWHWIINQRHYANVVQSSSSTPSPQPGFPDSWGLVYKVTDDDIERLDENEGVPVAYERIALAVDLWDIGAISVLKSSDEGNSIDLRSVKPRTEEMWVYVNLEMTKLSYPYEEYIYRMNMGIKDSLDLGMPMDYTEAVLRKYIPKEDISGEAEEAARAQAGSFREIDDARVI